LVCQYHPSFFLIYETHTLFCNVEKKWDSLGNHALLLQQANDHSGGIWVLTNIFDVVFTLVEKFS